MILLNFAHPLTAEQLAQVSTLVRTVPAVRVIATNVDRSVPLAQAACLLADAAHLEKEEWQTQPLIINPPGLAPLAAALLAEIHGRAGGFPALINVRPVAGANPPRYEVAEIVNLQEIRDGARGERWRALRLPPSEAG